MFRAGTDFRLSKSHGTGGRCLGHLATHRIHSMSMHVMWNQISKPQVPLRNVLAVSRWQHMLISMISRLSNRFQCKPLELEDPPSVSWSSTT